MEIGQWIVIGLSAAMLVWYLSGHVYNRRKGEKTLQWLNAGLQQFGKTEIPRLAAPVASRGYVNVPKASSPFRKLEAFYILETRENLPLWLFQLKSGKRDEIILRASLKTAPLQDLEAGGSKDGDFRLLLSNETKRPYTLVPAPDGYELARRGRKQDEALDCLRTLIERYPGAIKRFSLQSKDPHLLVRVRPGAVLTFHSQEFFEDLARVVGDAGATRSSGCAANSCEH